MIKKLKILIAYDGSECADRALDDLRWAGLPRACEALVLSVSEVWLPPPPPSSYEIVAQAEAAHSVAELQRSYSQHSPVVADALALADKAATRIKAQFPGWHVQAEGACGSPASEVLWRAGAWGADLVVVGSHGRTALGRFVLGSVAQKVVTEARTAVRVARGGRLDEPDTPVRILVGVDGSLEAELAVREVARRSWPPGSQVLVVIVDDLLRPDVIGSFIPPVVKWIEETNRESREWVQQVAERVTEELRAAGLDAAYDIGVGDPKRVLVERAEEWRADSIFVGSTGYGNRLVGFLLGSVSAAVVARAHCSVEVVRPKTSDNGANGHEK